MNVNLPTTATRVVLPGLVEPDGLLVETGPLDAPGQGQLLVAVEATGISFAEQAMRRGRYFGQPKFPFVPGYDLVGTVLAVGEDGDTSLIGQRVATLMKTGGWTTHAIVEARHGTVAVASQEGVGTRFTLRFGVSVVPGTAPTHPRHLSTATDDEISADDLPLEPAQPAMVIPSVRSDELAPTPTCAAVATLL